MERKKLQLERKRLKVSGTTPLPRRKLKVGHNRKPSSNGQKPPPKFIVDRFEEFRDDNGRFTKGNPGGPGNPHARRAAAYRLAFSCALNPEDLFQLIQQMVMRAQAGDLNAARYLTDRALGRVQNEPVVDDDILQVDERFL